MLPLYASLADTFRADIVAGVLAPGTQLPSEHELVAEYKVSRNTVRKALGQLVHDGLVTSRQGRGYFVREHRSVIWYASRPERNTETEISPSDVWSQCVRDQGREPSDKIDVRTMAPSARIASLLQLGPGELVVGRLRRRFVDGMICALADSYYPESIVGGTAIAEKDDVRPGVYAIMSARGAGFTRSTDSLVTRMPTRAEAEVLRLGPGTPITEHTRVSFMATGRPVRIMLQILPGDRVVIAYDVYG